jgi:tRNA 2-(methylsulfanyl)-N6-isopentenyladenosine37 hydroxylase
LIVQYPDKEKLVEVLTLVVAEEWEHFTQVVAELKKRKLKLGAARKDQYVEQLAKAIKKGANREQQLIEKLLMCALIEARSCERFRLLSKEISDGALRDFYHELMVSEAGHYKIFLSLAKEYLNEEELNKKWKDLLRIEARIISGLDSRGDRIH